MVVHLHFTKINMIFNFPIKDASVPKMCNTSHHNWFNKYERAASCKILEIL